MELEKIYCTDSRVEAVKKINAIVDNTANIDLSNLSEEGEKHFLGKTNITNCITEIPQRIKLELADGTLTLKAGSEITHPSLEYQTTIISEDKTYTHTGGVANIQAMIFVARRDGTIQTPVSVSSIRSGTGLPATPTSGTRYFDTSTGIIYIEKSGNWVEWPVALPIAIVTINENSVISSIDQVFNGMGYIGSTIFVDKGVKGLIPNCRNEDGTLKNIEFTTSKVATKTIESTYSGNMVCVLDKTDYISRAARQDYSYNANLNESFWFGKSSAIVKFVDFTATNGVISNFQPKQVFHALDYNDKSGIRDLLMPDWNNTIIVTSLPYTAPCEGWWVHYGINTTGKISIEGIEIDYYTWQQSNYAGHQSAQVLIAKGDVVTLSSGNSPMIMKFIPCKGAN